MHVPVTISIVPTLGQMAAVYRLPTTGGPTSPRFESYVALARSGAPVYGYNPMTKQPALASVEALLAIDAESVARDVASDCLDQLSLHRDLELSITVATPGMWTDRLATEVHHRLGGATWSQIILWTGEDMDVDVVRREVVAQTIRAAIAVRHGPPETVAGAAGQEGLAMALSWAPPAGGPGSGSSALSAATKDPAVAEALTVLGEDRELSTMAALLYGDEAARDLGWTPLGLRARAGIRHSAACAAEALTRRSVGELFRSGWTPLD